MTTQDYIKELKKYLSDLENEKRDEILKEIESYVDESKVDYALLTNRFGTPKELAQSYLEDMPIKDQTGKKIWSKTKKIMVGIFIALSILCLIIIAIIYFATKEPFDYSKYNAKTIDKKIEAPWVKVADINSLDIKQSRVIGYWTKEDTLQISCEGDLSSKKNNVYEIKQADCFIKIPEQIIDIKSYQSKLILIEPKNQINFDVEQSRIKIFEAGKNYKYDLKGTQSHINNFSSKENGILIQGKFYQSKIDPYKY